MKHRVQLTQTWDGRPAEPQEHVELWFALSAQGLRIGVDAPWHGDPPPSGPPGPTDRLWEHEVVELFIHGPDNRYTEIELSPSGHHLVLQLEGVRQAVSTMLPMQFGATINGDRWTGTALIEKSLLPAEPHRVNAAAIHGNNADRTYLSWVPLPGPVPDFHQPECFRPIMWATNDD